MDTNHDYERLVEEIRTQSASAPGSDTERVTIRSLGDADYDAMTELLEALEGEAVDPDALEFVLSPENVERVLDGSDAEDAEELEDLLGRTVRVEDGMPDDTVLLLDPDAIEGDDLVEPDAIAAGTVGR